MKKLSLILFLCLFTTNVFCEKYDGNYWDKLSKSNLTAVYIMGFSEAYTYCQPKEKDNYPYYFSYGEITDFTNKFYSNPKYKTLLVKNVLIEIIFPALKDFWSKEKIDSKALELLEKQIKDEQNKENTSDIVRALEEQNKEKQ